MKALVKVDCDGNAVLKDIPEPKVQDGTIKIAVKYAGICGTDLHILKNEYRHNVPVVMGHEFSGVVVEVGDRVNNVKVGDRVVSLTAARTCGHCDYCLAGIPMLCRERVSIGSGVNGAFADYLVIDHRLLRKIPQTVSLEAAAITEPLACAVHGVMEMTRVSAGDVVVISGPGPIGLLALQVAKAEGGVVVVCGITQDAERLGIARDLGADHVVNVSEGSAHDLVMELTEGYGADVAVECAGSADSASNCLNLLRGRGSYHQLGLFGKPIEFNFDLVAYKELSVSSSFATTPSSYKKALKLLESGKVVATPIITAKLPLAEWRRGFDLMENKVGLKTLLYPEGKAAPVAVEAGLH